MARCPIGKRECIKFTQQVNTLRLTGDLDNARVFTIDDCRDGFEVALQSGSIALCGLEAGEAHLEELLVNLEIADDGDTYA